MWVIACSKEGTILIAITRSRYSVRQSSSVAGIHLIIFWVSLQPLISTLCVLRSWFSFFRRGFAMSMCTRSFSAALHTPGLWVFAFVIIFIAWSMSALLSAYMWQFPEPVSITGIFELSLTKSMRFLPPRGIIKSMYFSSLSISSVACLRLDSISWNASFMGVALASSFIMALFVFIASVPPFSIADDELLRHSADTSQVTFGLDS